MLDRFFAALAGAMAPLLVAMCERIANRKIPDDTVPKFMDGLLDIARDGVDRAVGVVQTGEWVWGELPNKSNISVDVCPGCDHLTTRHIEVTSLDLEARTGTFIYTPCTDCDCNHYLD